MAFIVALGERSLSLADRRRISGPLLALLAIAVLLADANWRWWARRPECTGRSNTHRGDGDCISKVQDHRGLCTRLVYFPSSIPWAQWLVSAHSGRGLYYTSLQQSSRFAYYGRRTRSEGLASRRAS